MRVIAGAAKGRKLQTIEGLSTRPTTDRIKETLFNIIAFDLPECHFLDLFSGSGAIGIEALSRGAKQAVFVEHNPQCQQVIQENLMHTKLDKQARVIGLEVPKALAQLSNEKAVFDIIFLDPPYEAEVTEPALLQIVQGGLLDKDGYIIVERSAQIPLASIPGLRVLREKEYRTTVMTFLCLEEEHI
ncbi:16S rRNA (guanine(966)-N(2))-methyltransferase RsmD [Anaerotignum sp. MB30-C6]|uniref:16S rRNA (guanine(966)-N(2))-methyltransferase RsmD n=1 Tax=Anaerotignum sp. MB30-C6 TaxID=3070814 RepID=UPI0027DC5598|nr:16S rRNA (guanine(966)-N(2))-methyltransferase RsmD [Anaerotignum sp. MB30-C6]WMI81734.1 16S rRNA (guanine(966)-N(2))-methyltransferase RsmD [Anaerotignum sp. MB30-C6]